MIYVIGDIHGCLYSFKKMLKELNISKEDKLIALGDVIDRGNFSFECLDLFMNTENFALKWNLSQNFNLVSKSLSLPLMIN